MIGVSELVRSEKTSFAGYRHDVREMREKKSKVRGAGKVNTKTALPEL